MTGRTMAQSDVDMARVLGMTLLPQLSGLVLMLAGALWGLRRVDKPQASGTLAEQRPS
jgi:hypothetical protein